MLLDLVNPKVISVDTQLSSYYSKCKVVVTLHLTDKDGEEREIVVKYPIQGDNHLVSLMNVVVGNREIIPDNETRLMLQEAIENVIGTKGATHAA